MMKWKVSFRLDAADDDTGIVEVKNVTVVPDPDE